MILTSRPASSLEVPNPVPNEPASTDAQHRQRGAAQIPDSVAALSYGSRVVGRLGGGPRIF